MSQSQRLGKLQSTIQMCSEYDWLIVFLLFNLFCTYHSAHTNRDKAEKYIWVDIAKASLLNHKQANSDTAVAEKE